MEMMHTKLPEFIKMMKEAAAASGKKCKECFVVGLENLKTAKMQSMRTGRIQKAVKELAVRDDIERVEVAVIPRLPESMHCAIVRGWNAKGEPVAAILENINILHPTEDVLIHDFPEIDDRRPRLGQH